MRKVFKPSSTVFPEPVLMIGTYDKENKANIMAAAWGGLYDTNQIIICLDSAHKTSENIREINEFSVAFATKKTVEISDYFGMVSGYDEDKISKAKVSPKKCEMINAPYLEEYPVHLECRVESLNEADGSLHVVGNILAVVADESVLDSNGVIDIEKLEPIAFNPATNTYNVVKEFAGQAFSCGLSIK